MIVIGLFILIYFLLPLSVSFIFWRKWRWYVHFVSFSLITLICWYGVIESGISNALGEFYYQNEVYDLETLTLMYYLVGIVPLVIIMSTGVIMMIIQAFRKRNANAS
ncbi:MAG TPA: hypothetical protein VGD65_01440 [Chryseosolibacter sp.]